jgi:hypothetical protein
MDGAPKLIETGVRHYMHTVLHKCYEQRIHLYSAVLNVGILVVFVLVVGCALWYGSSRKLSPEEQKRKMVKEQQYILSKIRDFQVQKQHQREQLSQLMRRVEPATTPFSGGAGAEAASAASVDLVYAMAMDERR